VDRNPPGSISVLVSLLMLTMKIEAHEKAYLQNFALRHCDTGAVKVGMKQAEATRWLWGIKNQWGCRAPIKTTPRLVCKAEPGGCLEQPLINCTERSNLPPPKLGRNTPAFEPQHLHYTTYLSSLRLYNHRHTIPGPVTVETGGHTDI
jgi:hypothetical protein